MKENGEKARQTKHRWSLCPTSNPHTEIPVNISSPERKYTTGAISQEGRRRGGGIKKKGKKKDLRGLCRGVWGLFYSPLPAQELYKLHRKRKALPSQDAAVVAAGTLMSSTCPSDPVAFVEHWAHLKHWENRVLIPWALHRKETLQAPDDRRQTDRDEIHKQHAIQYHAFPMSFLESVFIHSPHLFLEVPPGNHLIWIQTQHSESKRKTY